MEKESATIHIQTRLTPSEYEPFKNVIENFDIKKLSFFAKLFYQTRKTWWK